MEKLFRVLPVLVWVALVVAWTFPALALGVRFELWGIQLALPLLAGAALTAALLLALAGVALLAAIHQHLQAARHRAILVIVILIVPVATVFHYGLKASQAPVLYDVSTGWANPPAIAALSGVRPEDANPLQTATTNRAVQSEHYPDIQTLVLPLPVGEALGRVQQVATDLGWEIQAVDAASGVVEATDTTFWFGFVDDIAIRVGAASEQGATVDIRSVSRVGKSDLGKNAQRIRTFLSALQS